MRHRSRRTAPALVGLAWLLISCGGSSTPTGPTTPAPPSGSTDTRPLRQVGQTVNKLVGTAVQSGLLGSPAYRSVVVRDFDYLTAEYEMKWDSMQPSAASHNFSRSDAIVSFAEMAGARVKGHALIWHASTPAWASALGVDDFRAALDHHIRTTVARYRGRVFAWDVVNEAVADSGAGLRNTEYLQKLGEGYIADAFRAARAADPGALLFYNDYNGEGMNAKSNRIYDLMRSLLAQGVPIDGIGLQMHVAANNRPTDASIAANMRRLADLGLLVNISEMDVKINGIAGTLDSRLEAQRSTYRDVVRLCVLEPRCHAVTFWGFTDAHTWITGDLPLLYDAQYAPKPAFYGVLDALAGR